MKLANIQRTQIHCPLCAVDTQRTVPKGCHLHLILQAIDLLHPGENFESYNLVLSKRDNVEQVASYSEPSIMKGNKHIDHNFPDVLSGPNGSHRTDTEIMGKEPVKYKETHCSVCNSQSQDIVSRTDGVLRCMKCYRYFNTHHSERPFKSISRDSPIQHRKCQNCRVEYSPYWRRGVNGDMVCNACYLRVRRVGMERSNRLQMEK